MSQRIYDARNRPTLTQQIFDNKGRFTNDMMKQLKAGTELEGYLEQEVGIPNPVQLECRVAEACSGVKGDFLGNKSWEYLRFTVFGILRAGEDACGHFQPPLIMPRSYYR
jgi:hypothetical protein